MNTLKVTLDPKEVGMSAERLALIDTYFKEYVDDGRLPGYHVAVARYGQIVYSSTYGMRDVEAKLPIEQDTVYRIFSMTKPITSIAIMLRGMPIPLLHFYCLVRNLRRAARWPCCNPCQLFRQRMHCPFAWHAKHA